MIVGICGEAGSGKSTASEVFVQNGYVRGKFAGALKEMMRAFLRYRGVDEDTIERMIEGDLKETPTPKLNGVSPRYAMQTLGTEWGRDCICENLWVDTEFEAREGVENLLFDDVRHHNESDAILLRGGKLIHVVGRASGVQPHHSETYKPPSEATVIKNNGTVDQFKAKISNVVTGLE